LAAPAEGPALAVTPKPPLAIAPPPQEPEAPASAAEYRADARPRNAGADAIIGATPPAAYRPILSDWPDNQVGMADVDYESMSDTLLGSRNKT
jgi:hypothetical protein